MTIAEPFFESVEDYDAFHRLLGSDLPDTHNDWCQLLIEQRLPDLVQAGHAVRETTVKPDEFVRYCRKIGASSDLQTLRGFATAKLAGARY